MQIAKLSQMDLEHALRGRAEVQNRGASPEDEDQSKGESWSLMKMEPLFRRRASKRSLLMAFRQLSLLVETGIDVAEALELVAAGCKHEVLQESLEEIFDDISNGSSLSMAADAQRIVLGDQVTASIQAGEASGRLVEVLRQIANQLEEELQIKSTITGALAYPAILCVASIAVAAILVWFVLPQFEESFAAMGADPPALTQILLGSAGLIRQNLVVLGAGVSVLAFLIVLVLAQAKSRQLILGICFYTPVIGPALRNLAVGRLFVSLGHLLSNGISLLEAIQLVNRSTTNGAINRLTDAWQSDVIEGKGLSHSLANFSFLPDGADAMIVMAERSGKLESVLTTAGTFYRNEGSTQLKTVLKLSEPLIIIVLGAFVGIVVASVLLPILDVQSAGSAG